MPKIEISYSDLCSLVGKKISREQLEEEMQYAKAEVESFEGDILKVEVKDSNRPDLWSAEGMAREIAGRNGRPGMPRYGLGKSGVIVNIENPVSLVRPKVAAAVVRGLKFNDQALAQLIQVQEKIAGTFGRGRREAAIGVYDLAKVRPPIKYTALPPGKIRFVPLGFERELSAEQILLLHPKGKEFGHLIQGSKEYPVFLDMDSRVLSMPPIINSEHSGRVSIHTRDVLVECTGFDYRFLNPALNSVVAALADRGGRIETVEIRPGKLITPSLSPGKIQLDPGYVRKISGLDISMEKIIPLLKQARYNASSKGKMISVEYPAYRQDIIHQRDIVEDVLISFGFGRIRPSYPKIASSGSLLRTFHGKASRPLLGLGFQEIASHVLSNKESLFTKMNAPQSSVCEIENPISSVWTVFRTWLLPSVLDFISKNRHVEYPQKVFEFGDCVLPDNSAETLARDVKKLSAAITDSSASYEDISSVLDAFFRSIGIQFSLRPASHPSFLRGRSAEILVKNTPAGQIGEVHPQVLNNWGIEKPVSAFELDLSFLF